MTSESEPPPARDIDPLLPAEMARKAEAIGAGKARLDTISLLALAVLAGADIAFGAIFMTTTMAGAAGELPFGVVRMLGGVVFSLGLILVVVGGAELFTGNNLMVMAWASGKISTTRLLRAWALVFLGNFVGGVGTALMAQLAGWYKLGGGAVGKTVLDIGAAKSALPFVEALFLGVLCNVLVCLAIWLTYSCRSVSGKVLVIVPPIAAFVAAGFEHSVANMFFLPMALLIKWAAPASFWETIGASPAAFDAVTVGGLAANMVPVTIGNLIGGGVLVGIVYWFIYLRKRPGAL